MPNDFVSVIKPTGAKVGETAGEEASEKRPVPVLPVRDTVLFPHAVLPLTVGRDSSIQLIQSLGEEKTILVVAQRDARQDAPVGTDLHATGTRVTTSYGWTDFSTLMPSHLSLTDQSNQDSGWNIDIRQPLPALPGLFGSFGRFEASAELRNLLAQGYLPVVVNDQRAVLTNSPRAVRGGLSLIF